MADYSREMQIVAEAVATKVSYDHVVESGVTTLVRRFPNIRDERISSVLDYLNTLTTVDDPKVDGNTYAGTWRVVSNHDGRLFQQEQGQGVVQILSLGTHITTGSRQSSDCRYSVYRQFYFGVGSIPACPPKSGTTTYQRGPVAFDKNTGLFSTHIDTVVVEERNITGLEVGNTPLQSVSQRQQLGVTTGDLDTITETDGEQTSREVRVRDDCSVDAITTTRTAKPKTVYWNSGGHLSTVHEGLYDNALLPFEFPTVDVGDEIDSRATINEFGLYNAAYVKRTGVYGFYTFQSRRTPFEKDITIQYNNAGAPIPAPNSDSGMYRSSFRPQNNGLYSGEVVYTFGDDSAEAKFRSLDAHLQYEDTTLYKSRNAQVSAPADVQGILYRAENTLGDNGLYDGRVRADASIYRVSQFVSRISPFKTADSTIYRNATVIQHPVAPASGSIQSTLRLNDDATFDQTVIVETSDDTGKVTFQSRNEWDMYEDTTLYRGYSTHADAPDHGVQGLLFTATNSLRDDGLYDSAVQKRVTYARATPWDSVIGRTRAANKVLYSNYHTTFDVNMEDEYGLYTVQTRPNPDSTFDIEIVYNAPRATQWDDINAVIRNDAFSTDTSQVYFGRTEKVEALAATDAMYIASNERQEDGTINSRLIYSKPKGVELYDAWITRGALAWVYTYRNQAAGAFPAATVNGFFTTRTTSLNDVTRRKNRDGTEDVVIASRPSITTIGGGSYWNSFENAFLTNDVQFRKSGGVDQSRTWTFAVYIKQTDTESSAFNFVNNAHGAAVYDSDVWVENGGDNFRAMYKLCVGDTGWV